MKALTLLPKSIKEKYTITRNSKGVYVHRPAFVNVDFDSEFYIETNGITYTIANSKVSVRLWIESEFIHITVYPKALPIK